MGSRRDQGASREKHLDVWSYLAGFVTLLPGFALLDLFSRQETATQVLSLAEAWQPANPVGLGGLLGEGAVPPSLDDAEKSD